MPSWEHIVAETQEREYQQNRALERPFSMIVSSVNSFTERGRFSFFGAEDREVTINHPFLSTGSWIRGMPEGGAEYVGVYKADQSAPQPIASVQSQRIERIDAYRKGKGFFRNLNPGEIEMHSRGAANQFLARRPKIETRGGVVTTWLDQDKLQAGARGPQHVKQLLQHRAGAIGDEERLGIVTRWRDLTTLGASLTELGDQETSTWMQFYPKVRENFTAEHLIHLTNPANESPAVLYTRKAGHVIDDAGEQELQTITQVPLRFREVFFSNEDTETRTEIDEKGNVYEFISATAVEGYQLDVEGGSYRKNVGVDEFVSIAANREHIVQGSACYIVGENYDQSVTENYRLSANEENLRFQMLSTPGEEKILLSSRSGHFMVMDDTSGAERIYIIHKSGTQLTLNETGSAQIVTSDGSTLFMNAEDGSVSLMSGEGSFLTLKDVATISDATGRQTLSLNDNTIQLASSQNIVVNGQKVTIGAGSVDLGSNAVFSAVIAEQLELLFDGHTHATAVGASSPPLPPLTAALINANPATAFKHQFVKIRGNLPP